MKAMSASRHLQRGVSMIEVLVTMFVLLVGMLGVAGMSLQSQRASMESFQRNQALFLIQDMVNRISANRSVAACYAFSDPADGAPYAGIDSDALPECSSGTATAFEQANRDLDEWDSLLRGAAVVTDDGDEVGAMIGARGCVSPQLDADDDPIPGRYQITVVWQGLNATGAPAAGITCGTDLYGDEALRRAVTLPLQIADLEGA